MGLFGIVKYDREQFDGWWLIAMRDVRGSLLLKFSPISFLAFNLPTVNKDARCNSSLNKNIPPLSVS